MKFEELYNRIIELWPEEVDISDGFPSGENGYMFPTLSRIKNQIENSIDFENDHWGNVGAWAFFQAFHETAKKMKTKGEKTLKTRLVEKKLIDKKIHANLAPGKWDDEWAELRGDYKGLA
ncbi:hypothetical protein KP001_01390 [Geomonas subterranea]|uniref:Uncharacterized protein n=2 Tax=Geomonas TaxID=2651583 RepID=A0ABX8LLX8_9BACT|nr:hypothetical protein [Geomonas subterranea]QXE91223.1 hypothetical protein KP001_01390 [Geomonas subterranea]QXM10690.1 hypothetical protein KP002_06100 [Geomonas subterranea]